MSYVPPIVDASGQTLANLQARGFDGYLLTLVASLTTDPVTPAQTTLAEQLLQKETAANVIERVRNVVDSYTGGAPVPIATLESEVFDLQLVFAAAAAALGEIGALIDAHQGTIGYVYTTIGQPVEVRTLS